MKQTAVEILEYINSLRVISSHNHHLSDELYRGLDLNGILQNSYANWADTPPDINDAAAVDEFLNRTRCNSFVRWICDAFEQLYGVPFTGKTALLLNETIKTAYAKNENQHLDILQKNCRFDKIINDRQPVPGYDLGHPELFAPSFRCDGFFSGYLKDKPEPNGFFPYSLFEENSVHSLPGYLEQMRLAIKAKKQSGCVALKVAIAYERPLNFENTDIDKAAKAFNNREATEKEILDFGDVVMFHIAEAAADFSLPLQIHTGMGQCRGTNPMQLLTLIERNPNTTFHLLHGGFPWLSDTFALLMQFKNVYTDTCWIPYLSTTAATQYIIEALEVAGAHRLTWGDDAWMAEDSYGALLAMEHALSNALVRMIEDGAIDLPYALYIAKRMMHDNAKELFDICD
ncbi:MAG: amidohydrolase family protein [Clostridiales bacterium]|nr:amidohydrolase family protein [Clostridiales bacterium]